MGFHRGLSQGAFAGGFHSTCSATLTSVAEASLVRSTVMAPRKPNANVPAAWAGGDEAVRWGQAVVGGRRVITR